MIPVAARKAEHSKPTAVSRSRFSKPAQYACLVYFPRKTGYSKSIAFRLPTRFQRVPGPCRVYLPFRLHRRLALLRRVLPDAHIAYTQAGTALAVPFVCLMLADVRERFEHQDREPDCGAGDPEAVTELTQWEPTVRFPCLPHEGSSGPCPAWLFPLALSYRARVAGSTRF